MSTICSTCDTFTCTKPIPECATTLNLGQVTATTGEVSIYVYYTIGGEEILYRQNYDQAGYTADIILDLALPITEFYNRFNGIYKIWITDNEDNIHERLTMTASDGTTATIWGVEFVRVEGNDITTAEIVPV